MRMKLARTRSISIAAAPGRVHGYVADAHNLPEWAPAFASAVRPHGEHWTLTQDDSEIDVAILADPAHGTINIVSATDQTRGAFLRVLPSGDGSELLFTLLFPDDTPQQAIEAQMATVDTELAAISSHVLRADPRRDREEAVAQRRQVRAMVPAQLNIVTLGAHDLSRLRTFYAALGWEVAIEAEDFCAFQLQGALLALFPWEKLAIDGHAAAAPHTSGMRGFSLGINVDRPEQVDEIIATVEQAGATVTKPPSDPSEFEGRHAYFADPEENYWEVVYLPGEGPGQDAVAQALGEHSQ